MKNRPIVVATLLALQLLCFLTAAYSRNLHRSEAREAEQQQVVPKNMTAEGPDPQGTYTMKIGSSPPRCEQKCSGCMPCEPAEVPATSAGHGFLHVQYTNYKPEGWKCKCGPSFYNP